MSARTRTVQQLDALRELGTAEAAVESLFSRLRDMARERDDAQAAAELWGNAADQAIQRAVSAEAERDTLSARVAVLERLLQRAMHACEAGHIPEALRLLRDGLSSGAPAAPFPPTRPARPPVHPGR